MRPKRKGSRSTSPRRDHKREGRRSVCGKRNPRGKVIGAPLRGATTRNESRRSVCGKRNPESGIADKRSLANSGEGRASARCSYYFANKGAFDANAPTTFTAMPENDFMSMSANNSLLQIAWGYCLRTMASCKLHRTNVCERRSLANCIGLMFANNGLLQNCMGLLFANNGLLQTA